MGMTGTAYTRFENIERENRGFILDKISFTRDDVEIAYIKIENIPAGQFRRFYPTIFNYMAQISGRSYMLPREKQHVRYKSLSDDELLTLLSHTGGNYIREKTEFEGWSRKQLLAECARIERKWLAGKFGDDFQAFRSYHVDKPRVAYVHVDEEYRRRGIGTSLYDEAVRWMRERGLTFRGSKLQSNEAKAVWERFEQQGRVRRDKQGRPILRPIGVTGLVMTP